MALADGAGGLGLVTATDTLDAPDSGREYAISLQGTHIHLGDDEDDNNSDLVEMTHLRLELGNRGWGLTGSFRGNRAHYIKKNGISPFISYGPDLSFRTHEGHNDYIDLTFGGGLGLFLRGDDCRAAAGVRGGLDWGTLGSNGLRPSVGAMVYGHCKGRAQLGAELNQLIENDRKGSREIAVDAAGQAGPAQIGVRYEHVHDSNSNDAATPAEMQRNTEHRLMIYGGTTHDIL